MLASTKKLKGFALFKNQRFLIGFTLIELLVVIAIIILLSSIGMVAARNVREKGKDAGIQATLHQVRIEATLIANKTEPNSYATLCCDILACDIDTLNNIDYPDTLGIIENEVRKYTPPGFNPSDYPECYANIDSYCVQFPLNIGGFYCLDSTGYAGTTANCAAGHIACQ